MLPKKDYPMIINTELQQLDFEIRKLQVRLDGAGQGTRSEYHDLIDVMRTKLQQARKKLKALQDASDDNWADIKADLDQTRHALKNLLSTTLAQVN